MKIFHFLHHLQRKFIQMKKLVPAVMGVIIAFSLNGCLYDFVAPEKTEPIDTTTAIISFATEIQPIFTGNCILCHKSGGTSPNLTSGNAYIQINTAKYINTASPAQSLIYRRVVASGGFTGHKTVATSQAALILTWIQQGAKNN